MIYMSVREWQQRYSSGDFNSRDLAIQCEAGWYDWFCRDESLAGHLKKISPVVMGITEPFIMDNYYVWFKNNCTAQGTLYDTAHFAPLDGNRDGKYFVVSLDEPRETMKWTLYTDRFGIDAPEFSCANVRDLIKYVNRMATEMEQGAVPSFVAEKKAVGDYVLKHEGQPAHCIRMDSPHLFAYQSSHDYEFRIVAVSTGKENAPAGFKSALVEEHRGIYVFANDAPAINSRDYIKKYKQHRKGRER